MTVHSVVWAEAAIEEAIARLVCFRGDTLSVPLRRDEQAILVAIDALRTVLGRAAEDREWFVSYDVTGRSIVLQKAGDNEHQINTAEASLLRDELLAATVAEHEHRMLRGDS